MAAAALCASQVLCWPPFAPMFYRLLRSYIGSIVHLVVFGTPKTHRQWYVLYLEERLRLGLGITVDGLGQLLERLLDRVPKGHLSTTGVKAEIASTKKNGFFKAPSSHEQLMS